MRGNLGRGVAQKWCGWWWMARSQDWNRGLEVSQSRSVPAPASMALEENWVISGVNGMGWWTVRVWEWGSGHTAGRARAYVEEERLLENGVVGTVRVAQWLGSDGGVVRKGVAEVMTRSVGAPR